MYPNRRFAALAAALVLSGSVFAAGHAARPTHGNAASKNTPNKQEVDISRLNILLFRGETGADSNVTLGGWGSGDAYPTKEAVLNGSNSIKVTTHGLYQGARIDFKEPVDLSQAFSSNKTYMRFQVRFSGADAVRSGFNRNSFQDSRQAVSPFKKMRYLVTMADGTRYEMVRPVELPDSDDPDRWVPLSFPLAALVKEAGGKVPTGDGAKIKEVAIFGDKYQQFYIGDIRVITDETEIAVNPIEEQIIFAQQPAIFSGSAEGGASTLRYSWDFDASDGIQNDAEGRAVVYTYQPSYSKEGVKKYVVTLTVTDVDGLKKPASTTLEVEVGD